MAEVSSKQRRRFLSFADELAAIASDRAPDITTRRELFQVVQSIRKRFGFTKEQKQLEVWFAIHDGAATVSDLIVVTKFHRDDIHEITKALEVAKFIEFRKMSYTGRAGRHVAMIYPLRERNSFAPLKLNSSK